MRGRRCGGAPPPHAALIEHDKENDNEISTHEVVHTAMFTVEFPPNDAAPDEYNPLPSLPDPPPPICDMTQTPQVSPIEKYSDKHNEEHDECILVLIADLQLPPSLSINPTPPSELSQHKHITLHMSMSTPSELQRG